MRRPGPALPAGLGRHRGNVNNPRRQRRDCLAAQTPPRRPGPTGLAGSAGANGRHRAPQSQGVATPLIGPGRRCRQWRGSACACRALQHRHEIKWTLRLEGDDCGHQRSRRRVELPCPMAGDGSVELRPDRPAPRQRLAVRPSKDFRRKGASELVPRHWRMRAGEALFSAPVYPALASPQRTAHRRAKRPRSGEMTKTG